MSVKVQIEQSHLWVYIQKGQRTLSHKDICSPMFIAALFIKNQYMETS